MSVAFIIKTSPQAGLHKTLEKDGEGKKIEFMEKKFQWFGIHIYLKKTFLRMCKGVCFPFRV